MFQMIRFPYRHDPRHAGGVAQRSPRILPITITLLITAPLLATDVTTWHNDFSHTGQNLTETALKPANVNNRFFGKLFSFPIDGYAYAQPLYLSQLDIPGKGKHDVIFICTEHDSVWAFDAAGNDGPQSTFWHVSFIDPANGITPVPCADVRTQDLVPEIGITGTPAIDRSTGTMYLVERTKEIRREPDQPASTQPSTQPAALPHMHEQPHWVQHLHALDITTGAEKFGGPVLIGDTWADEKGRACLDRTDIRVHGKGENTPEHVIAFNALTQHQRPALLLIKGTLYIAYASHGDNQPVHGWILSYGASDLKLQSALCTSPDGSIATTWMAGASPAADGEGNLYLATGNGESNAFKGGRDYGESVLRVSTTQPSLSIADFYTPSNYKALNDNDEDLGSGGPLLLPDQSGAHPHELVIAGKEGVIYVLDRDHLGGLDAKNEHAVQRLHGLNYLKVVDHHEINVINTPAYFNGWLYYTSRSDPVSQFKVDSGRLSETPIHQATLRFNFPPPTPSISANGNSDGIVWVINNGNPAQLLAYDATDVSKLLYDSSALGSRDQFGGGVKFSLPIVADGKVFVAAQENLAVFGLLPPARVRPAEPNQLVAWAVGPDEIDLNWADNAGNETGYKIERAIDNGQFQQIDTTGRNTTSYADTSPTLRPEMTYRYRVRATNAAGDSGYSAIVSANTTAAPPDPALVAHYAFDEGTGPTAADSTANANNGTIHGEVVWAHGHIGTGALGFHGAGVAPGYVSITDAPQLRFAATQSFTVAAWVDPASTPDKWAGLITKSSDAAPGWGLWCDPQNHWVFGMPQANGNLVGGKIELGWHHVAAVQDGSEKTRTLYVDGQKVATGPAADATGTGELWIGGAKADEAQYVDARIDDIRIYNRPLDNSEIGTLASRHNPAAPLALRADAASSSQINLHWSREKNERRGIETGFRIERSTDGNNFSQIARAPAGATSYVDAGLKPDASYSYRIRATNASGDSPDSNVAVVRLTHAATTAPSSRPSPVLVTTVTERDSATPAIVLTALHADDPLFVDRGYIFDTVSDNGIDLTNAEHVQTANGNKTHTKYSLTYTLTKRCDVYLLISTRTLRSPGLPSGANGFTDTNATLSAGAAGSFRIFKATQDPGSYTLGPQLSGASFFSIAVLPAH